MSRYLPPAQYEKAADHAERALLAELRDARRRFRRALDNLNGPHSPTGTEAYAWSRDQARATIRDCVAALRVSRAVRGGVTAVEYGLRVRGDSVPISLDDIVGRQTLSHGAEAARAEADLYGGEAVARTVVVGPWREL